jgi:sulfide dehydrogenase cytochrome subunit
MILFSCHDDWESENRRERHNGDSQPVVPVVTVTTDLPGRTLAANCFQCHGTNGHAGELKIAGESSSEIIGELNEMKSKNPGSNIMNVHAIAYTAEEIKLIADFFSKQ